MAPIWASRRPRAASPGASGSMPAAAKTAIAISQRHGLPELLGRVLASRGVGLDDVPVTLDPTLKALMPDPSTRARHGQGRGAARRCDRAQASQSPMFGDYDVDGACSSALMQRFLAAPRPRRAHLHPRPHDRGLRAQPRRPSKALVKDGAKLIVTVDCGTTSVEPLARRRPARRRCHRRRSPSGRRAPARRCRRHQSQPPGRPVGPGPPVRGRRRLHGAGRDRARAAPARLLRRRSRRRPTCSPCSTSWRWPPCATWCRSRASTAPT